MATSRILDEYGAPFRYAHAAERTARRGPNYQVRNDDIDKLIDQWDSKTLRSLSSRLYANMGVPKAAVKMLADYSVGDAWMPTYTGPSDFGDGKQIAVFLAKTWYPQCNVKGSTFDWHQTLRVTSIELSRGGDGIWLKVIGSDGFPRIQIIPPHRLGSGPDWNGKVKDGPYAGYPSSDGVILDASGRPAAYRVLTGERMESYEDVAAENVIHDFDPEYAEQNRGLPAFTHALEDLRTCLASTEDERIRQMIVSRLHLTIFNESGGPDLDDPAFIMSGTEHSDAGFVAQSVPGGITYMTAGSGERIEQVKHETPGDMWENFQDRMIRSACAPVFPYGLVWKGAGQGTDSRADVVKARRFIQSRQAVLARMARQAISWAYSVFQKQNRVPLLDHPFSWSFSTPPRFSVDDGRESTMELNEWRAGLRNTGDVTESRLGMKEDEFYERRARSVAMRKVIARRVSEEISAQEGMPVVVEDREMAMLTPNEMATAPASMPEPPEPEEPEEMDEEEEEEDEDAS
jgi:hypothetical protein